MILNEFVASNGAVLADEDGDFEDWIEILNTTETVVRLVGFGLSDDPARPFRWRFPDVRLDPGDYLLVWASGKNRSTPGFPLHTNFSISAAGEPLLLTAPTGQTVDLVGPVALGRNEAYARIPDGGEWFVTSTPTPGSANEGVQGPPLAPPVFSHASGLHPEPFDLFIESGESDAQILYTLDTSAPREEALGGSIYVFKNQFPFQPGDAVGEFQSFFPWSFFWGEQSLSINGVKRPPHLYRRTTTNEPSGERYIPEVTPYFGQVVRARTIREGNAPSSIVSRTFFLPAGNAPWGGTLPALAITAASQDLFDFFRGIYTAGFFFDNWRERNPDVPAEIYSGSANYYLSGSAHEIPAHLEWFSSDGELVFRRDIGLRTHGGVSRSFPQKSLRIYSGDNYDPLGAINFPLFPGLKGRGTGLPIYEFPRFILRNSGNDAPSTRIRDVLGHAVVAPIGLDVQAHRPVLHFLNGEFWGLLNARERLDRFYITSHYGVAEDDVVMIDAIVPDEDVGEIDDFDLLEFLALREFFRHTDLSLEGNFSIVERAMDVRNFMLYHMAQIYLKNTDWPGNNIRVWRSRRDTSVESGSPFHDGRWRYIVYDLDFALAPRWGLGNSHDTLSFALEEGGEVWPNPDWATVMLRSIMRNEAFRHEFIQSFADHMATTFQPHRIDQLIDLLHGEIAPYLEMHAARWRDFRNDSPLMFSEFAHSRPGYVTQHILDYFDLPGTAPITFDVSAPYAGEIAVNTIVLNSATPGLSDPSNPFPWTGRYFQGVPLRVEARAYPGFEFAGWREEAVRSHSSITVYPVDGLQRTALFRKSKDSQLLHYWNFNEVYTLHSPAFSKGGGSLDLIGVGNAEFTFDSLRGFSGKRALFGDPAGPHLRVNNPVNVTLVFALPTTGYDRIRVHYETRRSGSGAGQQLVDYTLDGVNFNPFAQLTVRNDLPGIIELDFSGVPGSADNPDFGIRIRFLPGSGGTVGNNRFDNFSIHGAPILSATGQWIFGGYYLGQSWFEVGGMGVVAHRPDWQEWLFHDGLGWTYLLPGGFAFLADSGRWFWVPDFDVPVWFCYSSQEWMALP